MLPLFALMMAGCDSGFLDRSKACGNDVFAWWGDISWYVDHGEDGSFDFTPEPGYLDRIHGSYDFETGDFSFNVDYSGSYFLVRSQGSGFGTVFRNGDVDVLYTQAYEDVLGETWQIQRREERWGCDGDVEYFEVEDDGTTGNTLEVQTYSINSADAVSYQRAADWEGSTWVEKGSYHADFSRTYTYEAVDGSYFEEGKWGSNGGSESSWSSTGGDYDYVGVTNNMPSGGYTYVYDGLESGTDDVAFSYDWTYEYDGSGEGTYTAGDLECELTVKSSGACTYTCDNGDQGNC